MNVVVICEAIQSWPEEHRLVIWVGSDKKDGVMFWASVIALVDVKEKNGDKIECDEDPLKGEVYAFEDIFQHY